MIRFLTVAWEWLKDGPGRLRAGVRDLCCNLETFS